MRSIVTLYIQSIFSSDGYYTPTPLAFNRVELYLVFPHPRATYTHHLIHNYHPADVHNNNYIDSAVNVNFCSSVQNYFLIKSLCKSQMRRHDRLYRLVVKCATQPQTRLCVCLSESPHTIKIPVHVRFSTTQTRERAPKAFPSGCPQTPTPPPTI